MTGVSTIHVFGSRHVASCANSLRPERRNADSSTNTHCPPSCGIVSCGVDNSHPRLKRTHSHCVFKRDEELGRVVVVYGAPRAAAVHTRVLLASSTEAEQTNIQTDTEHGARIVLGAGGDSGCKQASANANP